jgi:hypothetical protein
VTAAGLTCVEADDVAEVGDAEPDVGAAVGAAVAVGVGDARGACVVVRGCAGFGDVDALGRDDAEVDVVVGPPVAAGSRPTRRSTAASTRAASASRSCPASRAFVTAAFRLRRSCRAAP